MEQYMWIIWLSIFVIALIIETLSSELVSVWFAFGSLIAIILSFIPNVDWWIELIVFMVLSLVSLLCLRPLANKFMKKNDIHSNIDEIIGAKGVVIKSANQLNYGEVKIKGIIWTMVPSMDTKNLEKDDIVSVVAVEGNKLIVKKVEE
ncbi:MAG: NfeD family protein [Bacilli bacterium]